MTFRSLWTALHGMLFGGFFLLAVYGFALELWRMYHGRVHRVYTAGEARLEHIYLSVLVALGWIAVLTGTYLVYPWYRAVPSPGVHDLSLYPKALLLSSSQTALLHTLGMEWKEHVAFIAPIVMTAVAYVWTRYRTQLDSARWLRTALILFSGVALFSTAAAALIGAFLNKAAPVQGVH